MPAPQHTHFTAQAVLATPLGTMLAAANEAGLAGLWFEGQQHHPGPLMAPVNPGQRHLASLARELSAYFASQASTFTVPLAPAGTAFQQRVWQALLRIEAGSTVAYGDIAQALGRPAAVRAVGAAVGRNPISILVPCHRVLGRDGSLTGYAGGLQRKQALLRLEGVRNAALEHAADARHKRAA